MEKPGSTVQQLVLIATGVIALVQPLGAKENKGHGASAQISRALKQDLYNHEAGQVKALPRWPDLFGAMSVRTNRIRGFNRWQDMLARSRLDCGDRCSERWYAWSAKTSQLGGVSHYAQLKVVNWVANSMLRYRSDFRAYGVSDYWAAPSESLAVGGDCEDYVALKYLALRAGGFPEQQLRIVIVRDRERDKPHAVLVAELDGQLHVLDNQADDLQLAEDISRYQPLYSFNATGKWVHVEVRQREVVALAD